MNEQKMLADAIHTATYAHHGQYDKGGHPYILHALAVMYNVRSHNYDITTQCIAVLHDVLEDTSVTEEKLRELGMSEEVIEGLRLMNHADGVDYFDYISNMKNNIRVLRVKRADIEHNFDIRRLKGLREKDHARLTKYSKAYVLVGRLIDSYESIETFKKENHL
jgi:Guanosine polyphosphate pyrophosphohydrolases/synthetases